MHIVQSDLFDRDTCEKRKRKQSITPIDQRDEEEEDRVAKQLLPQKFPQGALPPEEKNFHLMKKHTKLPPGIE